MNAEVKNGFRAFAGRAIALLAALSLTVPANASELPVRMSDHHSDGYDVPAENRTAREMTELWFGGGGVSLQDADGGDDDISLRDAEGDVVLQGAAALDIQTALDGYFSAREADYPGVSANLLSRSDEPPVSGAVLRENLPRADLIEAMQDRLNIDITDAVVTIVPDSVQAEARDDGHIMLYLCEWTFFDYDDLRDGDGGRDTSGYGTWHRLELAPDESGSGGYIILSDEYDESDILGLSTMGENTRREMEAAGYIPEYDDPEEFPEIPDGDINNNYNNNDFEAELQGIRYSVEYNVANAIAYSEQYVWHGASGGRSYEEYYNSAYANFNSVGGDCANFTSQAIKAGGMPEVISSSGWYYRTASDRSVTWASSTNHRRWFAANRGNLVEKLTTATEASIFPGSPVYYSTRTAGIYTHTVLCVGRNSAGRPIINSHNNDRWHALWNYYSSTATIDTVQLTSDNFFGAFQGYANPGTDFYAKIYNPTYARYAGADGNGNVIAEYWRDWDKGGDQIWHFERLDDGSYKITSARNQNCMAVSGSGYLSRTPIATESYDGSSGQQWYLYDKYGGYLFRASCTDRVLDYPNGAEYEDGTPLWTFGRNDINGRTGIEAQIYLLEIVDAPPEESEEPEPVTDPSGLRIDFRPTEDLNVIFSWDSVAGAAWYHINIAQNDYAFRDRPNVTDTSVSFELDPGDYAVTVTAYDSNSRALRVRSAEFTVTEQTYKISYDANGGSGAPASQTKIHGNALTLSARIPERTGYIFAGWNTKSDGSGTLYWQRTTYRADADAVLYAQWQTEGYTVTLDANGGTITAPNGDTSGTGSVLVYYNGAYGELPVPVREDYRFLGWYADAQGGAEKIETGMNVIVPEDHTLYARWEPVSQSERVIITLDAAGGMVSVSGQPASATGKITVEVGSSYGALLDESSDESPDGSGGALPEATRSNYIFLGWFTELRDGTEVTADTTVENKEAHTLYAHWQSERVPVTVTFVSFNALDHQDGESEPDTPVTKSVSYGESYGELPEPETNPAGRAFLGWFTEPDGGTEITAETVVEQSEAHTLYAHWEAEPENTPVLNVFVYQTEDDYIIRASFTGIPDDAALIAAGYRDGQLIAVTRAAGVTAETESAELRLSGAPENLNLDKIKLFVMDKSGHPVRGAAEMPSDAFGRA